MTARGRLRGFAVVLAIGVALANPNAGRSSESAVTVGVLKQAPLGLLGCVTANTSPYVSYCFAAYRITEGDSAGSVAVTAQSYEYFLNPQLSTVLPPDALSAVANGDRPTVRLRGEIPTVGAVDVTVIGRPSPATRPLLENEGCVGHPVHYELTSNTPGLSFADSASGTVAARAIRATSTCEAVFTTTTTGSWRLARGA